MKNKGPRAIPDFSRKTAPGAAGRPGSTAAKPDAPPPPAPRPTVKPHATSAKSGRRGQ